MRVCVFVCVCVCVSVSAACVLWPYMLPLCSPDHLCVPRAASPLPPQLVIKRYIMIMESMTEKELDSNNVKMFSEHSRIMRLARGSGAAAVCVHGGRAMLSSPCVCVFLL